ncbi:uncharacterized protein N7483_007295 [Penicillium malachiteum]|uniref:uncharacterized protein n=1 Tax=Penicillium malachiteum TaxID=1324776 RepID=UPI002546EB47|nr:uncharacterized protein N7483_007295 [Penicillium malachiteum]KAJ5725938.1 hypothetical protein N7483_007295 [Penicillium malachiteum]
MQTPSPFRLSRRQPSTRRNAGPQFATSPRFILSQTTPRRTVRGTGILDDGAPSATAPVAATPLARRVPPRSQRDVIDDSDDGELPRSTYTQRKGVYKITDYVIDSSPPEAAESTELFDAEENAAFELIEDSNKRRRIQGDQRSLAENLNEATEQKLSSSSPRNLKNPLAPLDTPAPRSLHKAEFQNSTPRIPPRPTSWATSIPANTKTPFRSKPRFMISTQKPPSSQFAPRAETPAASQPTSPSVEKRKLAFVLPPSPPPKSKVDDIPAPFSPSSRTLSRRGRRRSNVSGYSPGGMAAEVRRWVLEMGSKREQMKYNPGFDGNDKGSGGLSQYLIAARVVSINQAAFSSSGPLAFIRAERVSESEDETTVLPILAMGLPRRKPSSCSRSTPFQIKVGDLLGFHRGLAWDIDLHGPEASTFLGSGEQAILSDMNNTQGTKERWLVAMEWDLVEEGV